MKWTHGLLGLLAAGALVLAYKNSRFGGATPDYEVVEEDGPFEIRDYPGLLLVGTPLDSRDVDDGSSFMRLFRYISGSNASDASISMTSPVMMTEDDGSPRMSFIVPESVARAGAPAPTADDVQLSDFSKGRVAAYRFNGRWEASEVDFAVEALERWMSERGLDGQGEPVVAFYDPPFTPAFLRRNEVWLRID